jgi:tetratricopeptide (TPR) repeat protein
MARVEGNALESLQVLLQQNPDSLTFAHVADALLKEGRLEEATRICEEGIRRHPYYVTGHMVLGKCYLQRSQFDQAEKEFKRVLLFDPKHLAANKYFGDLMRQMGWDNTCESSYKKILQIDPLDKNARAVLDELSGKAAQREPESLSVPPRRTVEEPPPAKMVEPPAVFVPPITKAPPTVIAPFDNQEFVPSTGVDEERLFSPPPPETPELPPPRQPQPVSANREIDEDEFASILDDIFQDEVIDDRAERPPHFDTTQGDTELDRDFGFGETTLKPGARSTAPPPAPIRPPAPPIDDFNDDILAPPPRKASDQRSVYTAKADDEDLASTRDGGRNDFMDIEGLEPEPLEEPTLQSEPTTQVILPLRNFRSSPVPEPPSSSRPTVTGGSPQSPLAGRDKIVTPTLGEIYAAQGQFAKAISVFELLLRKDPNNRVYRDKIDYLRKRLQETENAG